MLLEVQLEVMASAAKRQKVDRENTKLDEDVPTVFLKWCEDLGFNVNSKVRVSKQGSCSHYGMVSEEDIKEGEVLFTVPRDALLHPDNCSISSILKQGEDKLSSASSGWVPLLLCLMYEYTNSESKWRPYLDTCPDYGQLDQPMFWERETVAKELKSTGVPELVEKDEENIRHEYSSIAIPFMKNNPKQFDLSLHTLKLYRKMVAFVMAYSFTEPKKTKIPQDDDDDEEEDDDEDDDDDDFGYPPSMPMMVPMADILNHVAKNNARLQFGETSLSMVSTREIKKNEEVFNTYGQLANWQLLQMYGFAEPYPENIYDSVDLSATFLKDVPLAEEKFEFLTDNAEMYGVSITIGCSEVFNKWETCNILKILSMNAEEFEAYVEKLSTDESDEDFDEEFYEDILTFDGFQKIPAKWKTLLNTCAKRQLESYKNSLEQDLQLIEEDRSEALKSRERHALYVRYGQMKILEKVTQLTRV